MKNILLVLILLSSISLAEPSRAVSWLMNEPASLFDIGMIQLRIKNTNEWVPKLVKNIAKYELKLKLSSTHSGEVVYNWDENRITIGASFIGNPSEKTCRAVLSEYQKILIPRSSSLKYMFAAAPFSHINYSAKRPTELSENISKIYKYSINISNKERTKGGRRKSIHCSSDIDENAPTFQKFGPW